MLLPLLLKQLNYNIQKIVIQYQTLFSEHSKRISSATKNIAPQNIRKTIDNAD